MSLKKCNCCELCGQKTNKGEWLKLKVKETGQIFVIFKTCKICRLYLQMIIPKAVSIFMEAIDKKEFKLRKSKNK